MSGERRRESENREKRKIIRTCDGPDVDSEGERRDAWLPRIWLVTE